ncbi:MAG: hypothetical protein ACE5OZ_13175 [Candidatus Heimdallarchaeota archaeon]
MSVTDYAGDIWLAVGVSVATSSYGNEFTTLAAAGKEGRYEPWTRGSQIPSYYANIQFSSSYTQPLAKWHREYIVYNGRTTLGGPGNGRYSYSHFTDFQTFPYWGSDGSLYNLGPTKYFQVEECDRTDADPKLDQAGSELFAAQDHANSLTMLSITYSQHSLSQPGKRLNISSSFPVLHTSRAHSGPEFDSAMEDYSRKVTEAIDEARDVALSEHVKLFGIDTQIQQRHLPIVLLIIAIVAVLLIGVGIGWALFAIAGALIFTSGTLATIAFYAVAVALIIWIVGGTTIAVIFIGSVLLSIGKSSLESFARHELGFLPHLLGLDHLGRGELDVLWFDTQFMAGCFGVVPAIGALVEQGTGGRIDQEFVENLWAALMMYGYDLDGTVARFVFEYEMSMVNAAQEDRFNGWGVVLNPKAYAENWHADLDWENNPYTYYEGSEWWNGEF